MQARPSVKIAVQPKSNSKSALKFARNTIPYHTVLSRVSRNEKDRKKERNQRGWSIECTYHHQGEVCWR